MVEKWNNLLGCVWVRPRKHKNKGMCQLFGRLPPVAPLREFDPISTCELQREVHAGEAGHTPEWNLCHEKHIEHLYTHAMTHPSLWWDPDASGPLSGETLDPLEKKRIL